MPYCVSVELKNLWEREENLARLLNMTKAPFVLSKGHKDKKERLKNQIKALTNPPFHGVGLVGINREEDDSTYLAIS